MIRPSYKLAALAAAWGALLGAPTGYAQSPRPEGKAAEAPGQARENPAKAKGQSEGARGKSGTQQGGAPGSKVTADAAAPKAEQAQDGVEDPRGFKNALRELREEIKAGKLKKEDLKARHAELHGSRNKRIQNHRKALKERWGEAVARPPAQQELRHHEHRMAMLNRMLLVAETERVGKAKDKLIERIEKLIVKENERHERKMSHIKSGLPDPGNAPGNAPPSAGTPAATTPQPEKRAADAGGGQ